MVDILTSIRGKRLGLDSSGNLVVDGPGIILNNGSAPVNASSTAAVVAAGSALTLTRETHSGKLIALDTLTGSTVTLPAATGSMAKFRFYVSALATSGSHIIKAASASDAMAGFIQSMDDTSANCVAFYAVAGTSDTITLNRTTTGSVTVGEQIEIEDIAAGLWLVRGVVSNTGSPETPFSAGV